MNEHAPNRGQSQPMVDGASRPGARRPRFFFTYQPDLPGIADPKLWAWTFVTVVVFGSVLSLPVVTQFTGISATWVWWILGPWFAWITVSNLVLSRFIQRSKLAFLVAVHGNLFMSVGTALLLVVATGNPRSLLWLGVVLYACINGTLALADGSGFLLASHALGPLLLIPIFIRRGEPLGPSISGPLVAAAFSVMGYTYIGRVTGVAKQAQEERDAALAKLREREAELERQRIARDLHDSVGSTLALVGMYGDLVERHIDNPEELRRVSSLVRDATRDGLTDLRGLLSALAPHAATFGALREGLERLGSRVAAMRGIAVNVTAVGDDASAVPGPVRLAVVRCFQESLQNAVNHAKAACVSAALTSSGGKLTLEVCDDGSGVPSEQTQGIGLRSMRSRAEELGGTFELGKATAGGARVCVTVPLAGSSAQR